MDFFLIGEYFPLALVVDGEAMAFCFEFTFVGPNADANADADEAFPFHFVVAVKKSDFFLLRCAVVPSLFPFALPGVLASSLCRCRCTL